MAANNTYRIDILKVGEMSEVPSCSIRAMQDLERWEPFCYTCLVARTEGRTVVVNAGFPDDIETLVKFWSGLHPRCVLQRKNEYRVERQLERLGIDPQKVQHLIVNPLGPYSTGKIDLFTHAALHLGRTAWLDFHAPSRNVPPSNPRELVFPAHVLRRLIFEDWPRVCLLEDEDEVCPGIRVFRAGAHHKGSLAIVIDTRQGPVVYTDALFSYSNLERNIPMGFCRNIEEFYEAAKRIKTEAKIILPAFDPTLFEKYPEGRVVGA